MPFALAGLSSAYLVWWNGAEVGSRITATTSPATMTGPAAGTYTLRLYDSPSAGLLLAESASFTVASSAGRADIAVRIGLAGAVSGRVATQANRSAPVTTVADQSGGGNAVSIAAGAPTLAAAVQNGKPGISFPSGTVLSVAGSAIHALEGMAAQATVLLS